MDVLKVMAPMTEAVRTFETPVSFYKTSRRNCPEDSDLQSGHTCRVATLTEVIYKYIKKFY
jgi:hypothetical protein